MLIIFGFKFYFYSLEHSPIHVHVDKGDAWAKIELEPEIKVVENTKVISSDILVVNMFEGEETTDELANIYAVREDKFKGKFGETYLLLTYGKEPYRKVLVLGLGKKSEFCPNKLREAIAKSVKKAMQMEAKKVAYALDGIEFDYSEQFTIGAYIADYKFDKYKSEKKNNNKNELHFSDIWLQSI